MDNPDNIGGLKDTCRSGAAFFLPCPAGVFRAGAGFCFFPAGILKKGR
jgi:hypothetical protein